MRDYSLVEEPWNIPSVCVFTGYEPFGSLMAMRMGAFQVVAWSFLNLPGLHLF